MFPVLQIIGGVVGSIAGVFLGYWLFSPFKYRDSWLAYHLRTIGALVVMSVGMVAGQVMGYLAYKATGWLPVIASEAKQSSLPKFWIASSP
jgi:hypothetical protein